jgi:hypothetical protein
MVEAVALQATAEAVVRVATVVLREVVEPEGPLTSSGRQTRRSISINTAS